MLDTRFTPNGRLKRPKKRPNWRQIVTICVIIGFISAFCTFGLSFMLMEKPTVVQVSQKPSAAPAATPTATPTAAPSASAEQTPAHSTEATQTPEPTATPFATILEEDAENGKWLYETEDVRIEIERQQPLDKVTATVAVITKKGEENVLHTAFADGAYGKNVRARTREIAASVNAIFAINGDYCGYRNDGLIAREGVLYRFVPVREALCLMADGSLRVVREKEIDADAMMEEGLTDSWSFGPILVENGVLPTEFDSTVKSNNPRTALGQRADGSYVAVVVDGRSDVSIGMKMSELAQYLYDLGCVNAYNLDGGMTSCMYFNGSVISTPCGTANMERSLSDIIYILP